MKMNRISCPGENGMARISSSGAASFSSECAEDDDGVCSGIASTSSGPFLVRLCCPFVDFDDVDAIEAMFVVLRVPLKKGRGVRPTDDSP